MAGLGMMLEGGDLLLLGWVRDGGSRQMLLFEDGGKAGAVVEAATEYKKGNDPLSLNKTPATGTQHSRIPGANEFRR